MSGALASAHMVQHVLLVLVVAPLLALSASRQRAAASAARRPSAAASSAWRRRFGLTRRTSRVLRLPAAVWLLHVGVSWFWHASVPYDAAVAQRAPPHPRARHASSSPACMFWGVVIGGRAAGRVWNGLGVLLVFTMAMQSTFLAVLMTFAPTPWYSAYADTTTAWHLEPLADQQLAGVIMWVPAGFVYLGVGVALMICGSGQRTRGGRRGVGAGRCCCHPRGPPMRASALIACRCRRFSACTRSRCEPAVASTCR